MGGNNRRLTIAPAPKKSNNFLLTGVASSSIWEPFSLSGGIFSLFEDLLVYFIAGNFFGLPSLAKKKIRCPCM